MGNLIRGIFSGETFKAFFGAPAKTEGKQGANTFSTNPDPVKTGVAKTKHAKDNPPVLARQRLEEPIRPHEQPERVKKADQRTAGRAKLFFQRFLGKSPEKKLETLLKKQDYNGAATLLLAADRQTALKLIKENPSPDLGRAIARNAADPAKKEATLALATEVIQQEVANHTGAVETLFRDNSPGSGIISELYMLLIPVRDQEKIRNIVNEQPGNTQFVVSKPPNPKTVSSENQKIVEENSKKALETFTEVSKSVPDEIQALNKVLFSAVQNKFDLQNAQKQILAGFFLRFSNPTMMDSAQKLSEKAAELKNEGSKAEELVNQRNNALLISKIILNFSNDVRFDAKEPHLNFINEFVGNEAARAEFLKNLLGK